MHQRQNVSASIFTKDVLLLLCLCMKIFFSFCRGTQETICLLWNIRNRLDRIFLLWLREREKVSKRREREGVKEWIGNKKPRYVYVSSIPTKENKLSHLSSHIHSRKIIVNIIYKLFHRSMNVLGLELFSIIVRLNITV